RAVHGHHDAGDHAARGRGSRRGHDAAARRRCHVRGPARTLHRGRHRSLCARHPVARRRHGVVRGVVASARSVPRCKGPIMNTIPATHPETPFVTPTIGTRPLAIDIGGTGLKALVLGADGSPVTERARIATPHPATPAAVLHALWLVIDVLGDYERVS